MCFVVTETPEQQGCLMLNAIRDLLAEIGIVTPVWRHYAARKNLFSDGTTLSHISSRIRRTIITSARASTEARPGRNLTCRPSGRYI